MFLSVNFRTDAQLAPTEAIMIDYELGLYLWGKSVKVEDAEDNKGPPSIFFGIKY